MCHSGYATQESHLAMIKEEFETVDLGFGDCFVSMFRPSKPVRGVVLVLSDIFGRSPFYRMIGRRLAEHGFVAAVPEMFSRLWPVADGDDLAGLQRVRKLDQRVTLRELESLIEKLRNDASNVGVGVLGFCLGGTLAMLLAAKNIADASVIYYGITERRPATEFAPFTVLDEIAKVKTPLLGFWGETDERVSVASVREADDRLKQAGAPHELIIYPDLPHSFLTFSPADSAFAASQESWNYALTFLAENLVRPRA